MALASPKEGSFIRCGSGLADLIAAEKGEVTAEVTAAAVPIAATGVEVRLPAGS